MIPSPDHLHAIRHLALDLDGTIYKGGKVFAAAGPFLSLLRELGLGHSFVTNNSSRSTRDYVTHLRRMGIEADAGDICSSTHATIRYLRERLASVRQLFVLGTASLQQEFTEAGFLLSGNTPEDEPEAVVVGFDTELTHERLCRAAYWIAADKPFVATHPDRICPTDQPTILVDCGSICAALEQATGRRPLAVPGKPDRRMLDGLLERHGLEAGQLAMVGDRLYTDMAMARAAGALGILVLTGETTADQVRSSANPPDLVVRDLSELGQLLRQAKG